MRQYIAATDKKYNTIEEHLCAPLFRKIFDCRQTGTSVLEIAAAGFYRVFLNGKELTKGFLAPYISNPDQVVYFDEYCVNGYLKETQNELLVLLGNGFNNANDNGIWDFTKASFRSAPKFSLTLRVDGKKVLVTDDTFEVFESPILFDDIRCGEWYDARKEQNIFCSPMKPVLVREPAGEYKKCTVHPIVLEKEIQVKEVSFSGKGYLYDFGENNTGIYRLSVNATEGQVIDMTFCEMRDNNVPDMRSITFGERSPEGYVQRDRYICKEGYQEYVPSFTYHGFRYVYVEGITKEQATDTLLTYLVIHSDIKQRASFSCSNEVINKIQECTLRSDVSNFHYFPTDCPHREKNGWTGDVAVSAEQLNYNFDAYSSLREWLYMVRKSQLDSGEIPGIVPTSGWGYAWGNGLVWDYVLVELVYQLYRFYGKKEIIEENIDAIEKYIGYMRTKQNEDGLFAYGLGDWCEAGAGSEDECKTPLEVTVSLTAIAFLNKASILLRVMERNDTMEKTEQFAKEVKAMFRIKYVSGSAVSCMSQTAQAMAIALGVFVESEKQKAYDILLQLIRRDNNRFRVGIIGVKYLFDVLCDFGDSKYALELIADPRWPSYGYLISRGATTLWEMFHEFEEVDGKLERTDGKQHIVSLNHHFYGSISTWFYRRIAGLDVLTKDEILISPCLECGLDWVQADYQNAHGSIMVSWKKMDEHFIMRIENCGFKGMIRRDEFVKPLEEGTKEYIISM